ncbi:hypothetical protein Syncc8109_1884 [Synechococcus sp. WH 8109]|nr:hypothetical protein Syncc8109_1884 [Synechococcus sp. WH 8109]
MVPSMRRLGVGRGAYLFFFEISGEFIHISDPSSHTGRKVSALRAKRNSSR